MSGELLILGCGYSGGAVARLMRAQGWAVRGTSRSGGAGLLRWPGDDLAAAIAGADAILSSIPPQQGADPAVAALGAALAASPARWLGYLSSVSVYGDAGGAWIDEDAPPRADSARARARIAAEAAWRGLGRPAHILRLPGIYGPGRSAFDKLRAGEARRIVKPGQVFNRIHVDDIAGAVAASIARPAAGGAIYNIADDEPAPPQDVFAQAAALLGVAPPPEIAFEDADLSPMARAFYADNRRIRSDRIRAQTGWAPRYPSYREGLAAILSAERSPG